MLALVRRSEHAVATGNLPPKPTASKFDRMLVAQAAAESLSLVMMEPVVACYPGRVRQV